MTEEKKMELETRKYNDTNTVVKRISRCECGEEIPSNHSWETHWLNECPLNEANNE